MRVGLVAPPWIPVPPPSYGGTELVVGTLAVGLARAGHEVLVVAHPDSELDGVEVIGGPTIPADAMIGQTRPELNHVLFAYQQLVARRPDIIHDHTTLGPLIGARSPRAVGIPVVTTNHGPFDEEARAAFGEAARTCAVVAISRSQAADAGDVPVAAVIHHGIDTREAPLGSGSGGYVACLGRFDPTKGLARAAQLARREGVTLKIAAKMWEPAERRYFRDAVRPLLGAGVEYVGELHGDDKYHFLGDATALLNPIAWPEPFGLNMIEAMMCGTPVVATPCGSAPELIIPGVNGFVGETDAQLVAAIHACADVDRGACRRLAERRFSTARMVADHEALFARLIAGRRLLGAAAVA